MTRRMPVLPQLSCDGCPCIGAVGTFGVLCSASKLFAQHCVRPVACIADELAWRNVAVGLAMVACYEHGLRLGKSYSENAKVLGWTVMSVTHKSPPQREP